MRTSLRAVFLAAAALSLVPVGVGAASAAQAHVVQHSAVVVHSVADDPDFEEEDEDPFAELEESGMED